MHAVLFMSRWIKGHWVHWQNISCATREFRRPFPFLMLGPMPAPGEISGAPGGRSQAQTAAGPQLHAAGRTEPTGPGTAAPIALSLPGPGGGCRWAHLQGARTAAGRCHEVTAVRKAAWNWQPRAIPGRGAGRGAAVGGGREGRHPTAGLSAASRRIMAPRTRANFRTLTLAAAAARCPFGAAGGLVRHLRNYEIN